MDRGLETPEVLGNDLKKCSFCSNETNVQHCSPDWGQKPEPLCKDCIESVYEKLAPIRARALAEEKAFKRPDYNKLGKNDRNKGEAV